MGVGAIFVSTLALERLPNPHNPPESQAELLAATLQPIVAFVVLGSVITRTRYPWVMEGLAHIFSDGLSIPFFSLGRNVHSRTLSLTATLTSRTRVDPEWFSYTSQNPVLPQQTLAISQVTSELGSDVDHTQPRTMEEGQVAGATGAPVSDDNSTWLAALKDQVFFSPGASVPSWMTAILFPGYQ